ncbi:MAG: maleylpyruvate isomerase family mycothiol-dependent enzyme [Acidimicrobiales bacterium]
MDTRDLVDALAGDGPRLVDAARRGGLAAPVTTCPGWATRDLLAHIGYVHRWATGYLVNGWTERVARSSESELLVAAPPDDELFSWVAEGHAGLLAALTGAPPELECWSFLPAPSPLGFWARRQAHETAVHRVDAELAAGGPPSAISPAFAADGIDELLLGFLGGGGSGPVGDDGETLGTLELVADDAGERWSLRVLKERVIATKGGAGVGGETVVRAPAAELYLLLWNRRTSEDLVVTGSRELLGTWQQLAQVTWS